MEGWIKLHRKISDSRCFANEGLFKVWVWCLIKANHQKKWVDIKTGKGVTEVEVLPGQFIFGRNIAAKELKMKPSTVNDRMKKLERMQNIVMQPNTHYSLISIINWDNYQSKEDEVRQAIQQPTDNQPTGNQQPTDTNKNDKNEKTDNNEKIYSDEIKNFINDYQNYVLNAFPKTAPKITDSLIENCCDTIDKLIRLDNFTFQEIYDSIKWASNDDFWSDQILSLAQLRRKAPNGNTKFVNLYTAYKKKDTPKLNAAEKRLQANIEAGREWLNE